MASVGAVAALLVRWFWRWRRKHHVRTGTLRGNKSVLDEVIEEGPPIDPQTGLPNLGYWFAEQREAVRGDMAVDLNSAFDDLEAAEQRRRDALNEED